MCVRACGRVHVRVRMSVHVCVMVCVRARARVGVDYVGVDSVGRQPIVCWPATMVVCWSVGWLADQPTGLLVSRLGGMPTGMLIRVSACRYVHAPPFV